MLNRSPIEVLHDFPKKLKQLKTPSRFKVLYGGRGGMKSWGIARQLLLDAYDNKLLVLCTREIQKSIEESVYRLLVKQISLMKLDDFYEVQKTKIIGRNGSEFVFAGLRHNMDNLKSFEGANRVWVEEAQTVSKASWDKLTPTVREPGSEIWLSFNPDLEEDYTYEHFVLDPPPDTIVIRVNYSDNPWFPDVLRLDMEDCKRRSKADYEHIWEGKCKQAVEGAIFASELAKVAEEQRFTKVPIQAGVPVHTFWDLGRSDNTAIWFVQIVGLEFHIINYFQANGLWMADYITKLAEFNYKYGNHCLPHDAVHKQIVAKDSAEKQLRDALKNNPKLGEGVYTVPRVEKKALGIEAARSIFGQCVFDKANTVDGVQCLKHYAYKRDEETGAVSKEPKHDIYSHGADAFLTFAQHYKKPVLVTRPDPFKSRPQAGTWMAQ